MQVADKSTADSIAVFDHWMRVIGRGVGGVCFVFWALQEAGYIPAAGVPWYASLVWLLLTAYPGAAAVWGRKDPSQWASMCLMAAAAAALLTAGAWLAAVSVLFWAQWLPWIRRQPEDAGPGLAPGLERSSWWQAAALAALGGAGWLLGAQAETLAAAAAAGAATAPWRLASLGPAIAVNIAPRHGIRFSKGTDLFPLREADVLVVDGVDNLADGGGAVDDATVEAFRRLRRLRVKRFELLTDEPARQAYAAAHRLGMRWHAGLSRAEQAALVHAHQDEGWTVAWVGAQPSPGSVAADVYIQLDETLPKERGGSVHAAGWPAVASAFALGRKARQTIRLHVCLAVPFTLAAAAGAAWDLIPAGLAPAAPLAVEWLARLQLSRLSRF